MILVRPLEPGATLDQLVRIECGLPITAKEWETMVGSCLSLADLVLVEDRVQGDLRTYTRCCWEYWPYRFETAWEVNAGEFCILSFVWIDQFRRGRTGVVRDTAEFMGLLIQADDVRRKLWG